MKNVTTSIKKVFKNQAAYIVVVIMSMMISGYTQAMTAPEDVVKQAIGSIIEDIQAKRFIYKEDSDKLFAMVETKLLPAIHIKRMAGLILGKHRRSATPEQSAAFAQEFKTFLLRSYATALLEYTGDEKINFMPVRKIKPGKVEVKAELVSSSGTTYPISLYMSNIKDTQWRAYNIVVSSIDFVTTYRSTFGDIITQKGIDGLITDLKAKNTKLAK